MCISLVVECLSFPQIVHRKSFVLKAEMNIYNRELRYITFTAKPEWCNFETFHHNTQTCATFFFSFYRTAFHLLLLKMKISCSKRHYEVRTRLFSSPRFWMWNRWNRCEGKTSWFRISCTVCVLYLCKENVSRSDWEVSQCCQLSSCFSLMKDIFLYYLFFRGQLKSVSFGDIKLNTKLEKSKDFAQIQRKQID